MGTLSCMGRGWRARLPVMLMVAVVVFAMLRLTPGDPAAILAGDDATGGQLEKVRQTIGLDKSIPAQFPSWIGQLMRGDLGVSLLSGTPVRQMIGIRMGPTLALALCTIALTIMVALP